jgi:hypothetical protein
MQTLTIDIINDKAIKLIKDMELLQLIRVRKDNKQQNEPISWTTKYKGTMQKQLIEDIDDQINELRSSWE